MTNFALRWLNLDEVEDFEWDRILFPEFSADLRSDFATEIELFLRQHLLVVGVEGIHTPFLRKSGAFFRLRIASGNNLESFARGTS